MIKMLAIELPFSLDSPKFIESNDLIHLMFFGFFFYPDYLYSDQTERRRNLKLLPIWEHSCSYRLSRSVVFRSESLWRSRLLFHPLKVKKSWCKPTETWRAISGSRWLAFFLAGRFNTMVHLIIIIIFKSQAEFCSKRISTVKITSPSFFGRWMFGSSYV